ncbi:MAG: translation initiation factor IF-2 [Planctomycetota bacterium]
MPIRVHKLAKELGVTSKDIMTEALNHGVEIANHMASLSEADANMIRAFLQTAPPSQEEKDKEAADKAAAEAAVLEDAKQKMAVAKAKKEVAQAKKEAAEAGATEAEGLVAGDEVAEEGYLPSASAEPAIASDERSFDALTPPDISGEAARARENEIAEAEARELARTGRVLSVSTESIAGSVVNALPQPLTPETPEEEEAPAEESVQPRQINLVSPTDSSTVVSKSANSMSDRKPTRELPQRRQAQILGHKEIPIARRAPTTRGRSNAPGSRPGTGTPGDPPGMIQTKSSGSKRTFVRAPQRGGGGRFGGGPGRGGPGGGGRGGRGGNQPRMQQPKRQAVEIKPKDCMVQLPINIKTLSAAMGVKSGMIIEKLLKNHGMFLSINSQLDNDLLETISLEFECEIQIQDEKDLEKEFVSEEVESFESDTDDMEPRAPIVTFLGHVDHGKTSLLDFIRKSRVADKEDGGITQHIGAYRVETDGGPVVFLDTPGHRAFTDMRARGANVTDVVVLVVAADDGVMPQTEEAIAHAKAADAQIIVAINKCDKPDANPAQVKQQLSGLGLQPEDWGGDTVCVEVSAVTGAGIDSLLEYLSLVTEILDLKADPTRPAVGTVIESLQKKGEGNVARVIITDGTLSRGDSYLVGHVFGKVKAIKDSDGKMLKEAGPAVPVEVSGLAELPAAGERFFVVRDMAKAKQLAEERQRVLRDQRLGASTASGLEGLLKRATTAQVQLIVKADTVGSLEVLKKTIKELEHAEVEPKIIHSAVGGVTDTDVTLADASDAIILGFHVTDSATARRLADEKGVEIRHYSVIYNLLDELKLALEGKLAPEERETITGHLEVNKIFKVSRVGTIAGCQVSDGLIRSIARARLTRDGIVIFEGKIASLRHVKDDVKEMKDGQECGVRLEGFDDIKVGDIIEPYEIEKIKRTLSD